jgi:hypothetical protein
MTVDKTIVDAIEQACKIMNESEEVSTYLLSWFESLVKGNESLETDPGVEQRRIEQLFNAIPSLTNGDAE